MNLFDSLAFSLGFWQGFALAISASFLGWVFAKTIKLFTMVGGRG